jgi:uncharacterized membrane protein
VTLAETVLIAAGTLTALSAGVMFAFTVAFNPAGKRVPDDVYAAYLRSVNVAIVNPVFLVAYLGPVVLLPLAAFLLPSWLMGAAAAVYIVGIFGVTTFGNIPLNNRLDKASPAELASVRTWFTGPWERLHTVRTLSGLVSVVLVLVAAVGRDAVG